MGVRQLYSEIKKGTIFEYLYPYTHFSSMYSKTTFISSVVLLLLLLTLFHQRAEATALTYNLEANENACFYVEADKPGKKIGFYFAVK